jgi:hypothetical protein
MYLTDNRKLNEYILIETCPDFGPIMEQNSFFDNLAIKDGTIRKKMKL